MARFCLSALMLNGITRLGALRHTRFRYFQSWLLFLSLFIFVTSLALTLLLFTPVSKHQRVVIYFFKPGMTPAQLATDLNAQGVMTRPRLFMRYLKIRGLARKLQAGVYRVEPNDTIVSLARKVSKGDVVHHDITIIEGWTLEELLLKMRRSPGLADTVTAVDSQSDLAGLITPAPAVKAIARIKHAEGLFLPETYRYPYGFSERALLQYAHDLLIDTIQRAWQKRAADLPYQDWYDALIVASLIEKETSVPAERALIAGVILNRIANNMPLQIDASVIYGLGAQYVGEISKADLKRKTPYNTYTQKGLPPTPIALTSRASLEAALHPSQTDYLYFVARGDGGHVFSATLEEHNRAVANYRRTLKK